MAHPFKIASFGQFRVITIIIVYLIALYVCIWGIRYVIHAPSQHQLFAVDIAADGGRTIRDLEKNDSGLLFRWLDDSVTLAIAQPTRTGILTIDYWVAPNRVATALHINTTQISLPAIPPLQQRRIAMLVFNTTYVPQTTIGMQFVVLPKEPIAWAFSSANWQAITPTPHPTITGAITLFWVASALSLQRIFQRHWVSITSASIGVLIIAITQPVLANRITQLIQHPQFIRNGIIIGIGWFLWYVLHPRLVTFGMRANPTQRLMMAGYVVVTVLPPIGMLFNPEPARIAVQEQRQRQECPTTWTGARWDVGHNFAILAQCVTDNIGWRSVMIRSKNELDYRLFGVSSRVYFGNNDFYFLRRWGDERFPALQTILQDPVQHQQLRQAITAMHEEYAANNMHMILVIAPSKDIIYPENLPWYAPRYDPRMVTDLEAELRDAGLDVIPATALMQQHKHTVPLLYHQRDFHWNDLAAYYVAQELVARIATNEQRPTPWANTTPTYHAIWKYATDQHFAALLLDRDRSPQSYGIDARRPGQATWTDEAYANQDFVVWRTPVALPQPALPNLAIMGDSFSAYFRNVGIEWYFETIVATTGAGATPTILPILQQQQVKYVVVQLRDVSLPLLLTQQREQ